MNPPILFDRRALRLRHRFHKERFLLDAMQERAMERLMELRQSGEDLRLNAPGDYAFAGGGALLLDEERLPFAPASFDIILSAGGLHWVNDLPGALIQLRQSLRPGGLFIGVFLGGQTLSELREAVALGSARAEGGLAARVSPMVDVRDAGALMQRAGFREPVADSEKLSVTYADPYALMRDLRAMNEANALAARPRHFTRAATMEAIAEAYKTRFSGEDGRISATFELVTVTGWG